MKMLWAQAFLVQRSLFIIFFVLFSQQAWSSIGSIVLATGKVDIQRANQMIEAQTGSALEAQDKIFTRSGARAQLRFNDDTVITLGSNTEFGIDRFLNEGSNKAEAKFNIAKGTFKAITGQIGKAAPDKFKVKTRTATIGVRGTIFTGRITENRETIATLSGQIFVTEDQTGVTVDVPAGQITNVTPGQPPEPPKPLTNEDLQQINEDSEDEGNKNADEAEGDSQSNQEDNEQVLEDEGIDDGDSSTSNNEEVTDDNMIVNNDIGQQTDDLNRQSNEQETKEIIEETTEQETTEQETTEQETTEPELTNADRNQTMVGIAMQTIEGTANDSVAISALSLNYSLSNNNLTSESTNKILFYDAYGYEMLDETQNPIEASLVHDLTLDLPEAQASYGGWSEISGYSMSFSNHLGEEVETAGLSIFFDDKQEFFYFTAEGDHVKYKEAFGVPLTVEQLPSSGIAAYVNPEDTMQSPYLINYANGHVMHFDLTNDGVALFSGVFFDDPQLGSGFVGQLSEHDFSSQMNSFGDVDYENWGLFGSEAQGIAFGLYKYDEMEETAEYDLIAGFKDASQTYASEDLTGTLDLTGKGNKYVSGSGLEYPVNLELSINKQSGYVYGYLEDYPDYFMFEDSAAYINSDNFVFNSYTGVWVAATDTHGIGDNEYVSWGYWGKPETEGGQEGVSPAVNASTWVAGEVNESVYDYLSSLNTSYTYNGTVMGQVYEGASWSHIDAANNEVQIVFNFNELGSSIDPNNSYINFSADGKDWNLVSSGGMGEGASFYSGLAGTHNGSAIDYGEIEGHFYGDQAQAIGGILNAESPTATAVGVFQGKRP